MATDRGKFEEDTKQKRRENTDALTLDVLEQMLKYNVCMLDTHYIRDRAIQIVEETIKKIDFTNKKIEKERRAFLDVLIDGMQKKVFDIDDEIKQAQKARKEATNPPAGVKFDREKEKIAIERLSKLERVKNNQPKNVSEERDIECEPVCQHIAKTILSKDWLLKDKNYTKGVIELDNELLISINALSYINELFEQLYSSIDRSYLDASENLWGCPRRKIRMKQLDNKLKNEST
jgi:hypothetical protein